MDPLEQRFDRIEERFARLEGTVSDLRVGQAEIGQKLASHMLLSAENSIMVRQQLQTLVSHIEPIRERSWRQRGAMTVWGLIGGLVPTVISMLTKGSK